MVSKVRISGNGTKLQVVSGIVNSEYSVVDCKMCYNTVNNLIKEINKRMKCKNPPNDFEKAIDENHVNI